MDLEESSLQVVDLEMVASVADHQAEVLVVLAAEVLVVVDQEEVGKN